MKNISRSIIVGLIVLFFASCYEDKGHYDHIYSNVLSINTTNENPEFNKKTVYIGEEVVYEPVITWRNPEADTLEYDYAWVFDQDTISTERCLRYKPVIVGTLDGVYVVKERKTGIYTTKKVSLTVKTPYAYGWMILSEMNERTAVSLLPFERESYKYDDEDPNMINYQPGDRTADGRIFWQNYLWKWNDKIDIYSSFFGENLGSRPRAVHVNWSYTMSNYSEVFILQENGGNWVLNGNDFSKYYKLEDDFGADMPSGFQPTWFFYCHGGQFLANDEGRLFWRPMENKITRLMPFNDEVYFGANARITKFIEPSMWHTMMAFFAYDEENKKLYTISATQRGKDRGGIGAIMTMNYKGEIPEGFVKFEDMGDYKPLCMTNDNALYNENNTKVHLFLEKAGKVYVQSFQFYKLGSSNSNYTTATATIDNMEAPVELPLVDGMTPNSIFMKQGYKGAERLFVGEGNKLYMVEMSSLNRGFKLWQTFPANIKFIEDAPDSQSIGVALDNGEFHIMFTDDRFFIEPIDPNKATFHSVYNLGNIVDVEWKSNDALGSNAGSILK